MEFAAETTLDYMSFVKSTLNDEHRHGEFLKVIEYVSHDLKARRIDRDEVGARVKHVLRGYPLLIDGFNVFLPKDYKIFLSPDEMRVKKKQQVHFNNAIDYLNKVKTRFQSDEHVYWKFVSIMKCYQKGTMSIQEVQKEVVHLFSEHCDLVAEFTRARFNFAGPISSMEKTVSAMAPTDASESLNSSRGTGIFEVEGQWQTTGKQVANAASQSIEGFRSPERIGDETSQERISVSELEKDQQKSKDKEDKDAVDEGMEKYADDSLIVCYKRKTAPRSARRANKLIRQQSQAGEGGEAIGDPSGSPADNSPSKLEKDQQMSNELEITKRGGEVIWKGAVADGKEKDPDDSQFLPNKRKSVLRPTELIRQQSQVGEGGEVKQGPSGSSADNIPSSKLEEDKQKSNDELESRKRSGKVVCEGAVNDGNEKDPDDSQILRSKRKSALRLAELIRQQSQVGKSGEAMQGPSGSPAENIPSSKLEKDQKKSNDELEITKRGCKVDRKGAVADGKEKDPVDSQFLPNKRKSVLRPTELIRQQSQVGEGGEVKQGPSGSSADNIPSSKLEEDKQKSNDELESRKRSGKVVCEGAVNDGNEKDPDDSQILRSKRKSALRLAELIRQQSQVGKSGEAMQGPSGSPAENIPSSKLEKDQKKSNDELEITKRGCKVDRKGAVADGKEKDPVDSQFLPNKRKSALRPTELIRQQSQVGEGGEVKLGPSGSPADNIPSSKLEEDKQKSNDELESRKRSGKVVCEGAVNDGNEKDPDDSQILRSKRKSALRLAELIRQQSQVGKSGEAMQGPSGSPAENIPSSKLEKDQKKSNDELEITKRGCKVDRKGAVADGKEKDPVDSQFLPNKRKSALRPTELIRQQSQVGEGGEVKLGPSGSPADNIPSSKLEKDKQKSNDELESRKRRGKVVCESAVNDGKEKDPDDSRSKRKSALRPTELIRQQSQVGKVGEAMQGPSGSPAENIPSSKLEKDQKKSNDELEVTKRGCKVVRKGAVADGRENDPVDSQFLPNKRKSALRPTELIRQQSPVGEGGEVKQGPSGSPADNISSSKLEKGKQKSNDELESRKRSGKVVCEGAVNDGKEKDPDDSHILRSKRKSALRPTELIRQQSQVGEGGEAMQGPIGCPADRIPSSKLAKDQQKSSDELESRKRGSKGVWKGAVDDGKEKNPDYSQIFCSRRKSARWADELLRRQSQVGEVGEAMQGPSGSPADRIPSSELEKDQQKSKDESRKRGGELVWKGAVDVGKEKDPDDSHILRYKSRSAQWADELIQQQSQVGEGGKAMQGPFVSPLLENDDQFSKSSQEQQVLLDKVEALEIPSLKPSSPVNKENDSNEGVAQLDPSNGERCTASYRLLPKNNPKVSSTHHSELASGVLNNCCMCVEPKSDDHIVKQPRRNKDSRKDARSLIRWEDARYKLDVVVERTAATAQKVRDLLEYIKDPKFEQQMLKVVLEDHLSTMNLICIERIYEVHGMDFIDQLRRDPYTALPVAVTLLCQKHDEWFQYRNDLDEQRVGGGILRIRKLLDTSTHLNSRTRNAGENRRKRR